MADFADSLEKNPDGQVLGHPGSVTRSTYVSVGLFSEQTAKRNDVKKKIRIVLSLKLALMNSDHNAAL